MARNCVGSAHRQYTEDGVRNLQEVTLFDVCDWALATGRTGNPVDVELKSIDGRQYLLLKAEIYLGEDRHDKPGKKGKIQSGEECRPVYHLRESDLEKPV